MRRFIEMKKDVCNVLKSIDENLTLSDYEENLFAKGLDSLGIARLIAQLEEKFSIEIDPEDILPENFVNVNAICTLLETYKK
jgi:phosphopantetheine attachment domain protein